MHPYRYSHLRKFIYLPNNEKKEDFTGFGPTNSRIMGLGGLTGFELLHPYAALSVATGNFPPDLALDAFDCWNLFSVMEMVARTSDRKEIILEIDKLHPKVFFNGTPCIRSADIIRYEAALRETIERWIATPSYKNIMASVTSALSGAIEKQVKVMETSYAEKSPYARDEYQQSLLPLLDRLNSADALPAIVFHYDRNGIECLAQELLASLESAERRWKNTSSAWQMKLDAWQKWQGSSKLRRKEEDKRMKLRGKGREEEIRENEGSWLDSFDPGKPFPQFSFQSVRSKIAGQELEDDLATLTKWNDIPIWMVDCLRRGIGIHHSGLNRRLRQLVETLFRGGTLRVVIATGISV